MRVFAVKLLIEIVPLPFGTNVRNFSSGVIGGNLYLLKALSAAARLPFEQACQFLSFDHEFLIRTQIPCYITNFFSRFRPEDSSRFQCFHHRFNFHAVGVSHEQIEMPSVYSIS